jgi:Flp pilus assembly protein TadD/TM2 domain-containing membrane protein YozV
MTENEQEFQANTDQLPSDTQPGVKTCKFCAEEIKAAARICRFCNRDQEEDLPHLHAEHNDTTSHAVEEKTTVSASERKCSFCREDIKRDAIICSHCGKNLSPKSTGAAYLFLLFLGGIGAHRFYLMQRGAGLFYLTCALFSYFTFGLSLIPAAILGLIDLFTLPGQVARFNQKLLGDSERPINADEAPSSTSVVMATKVIVVLPVLLVALFVILSLVAYEKFGRAPSLEQKPSTSQEPAGESPSDSQQLEGSTTSDTTRSKTFPIAVTVKRIRELNEYTCYYDRIKIVNRINAYSPRSAPQGTAFLVLFYDVTPESKEGSTSASLRTQLFAIETSDQIKYTPDTDAHNDLRRDRSLLSDGEEVEFLNTDFQPGIGKKLATVFQIPVEQLAKDPVLIVPEGYGMAKRIPLDSIAKAYGGGASTEAEHAPADSLQASTNFQAPADSSQASDLISQMIQNVQSDNRSFEAAFSALRVLPKALAGDAQKAEASNPIGLKALKEKDYSKAVSAFLEAVQADPSTARYMSNLGFAEMCAGDLGTAEKHTIQSIALAPDRRVAWNNLGQIKAKQDKQDEAIACFMIAYKLSKGESLVYLKSLYADDDQKIRAAGRLALEKLGQTTSTGTVTDAFSDH